MSNEPTALMETLTGFGNRWLGEVSDRAPHMVARIGVQREPLPKAIRRAVLKRDHYTCEWCGLWSRGGSLALEIDHILPWSAGGADHPVNLRTLCQDCNQRRSNRVSFVDLRAVPIVVCCRRCDLQDFTPGAEIDAFCLKCDEPGVSPYYADRLIGGPTPAVGLPGERPGLRDGSGVQAREHPRVSAVIKLLTERCRAQTVACAWCHAAVGEPCVGCNSRPLVRSAAHVVRLSASMPAIETRVAS